MCISKCTYQTNLRLFLQKCPSHSCESCMLDYGFKWILNGGFVLDQGFPRVLNMSLAWSTFTQFSIASPQFRRIACRKETYRSGRKSKFSRAPYKISKYHIIMVCSFKNLIQPYTAFIWVGKDNFFLFSSHHSHQIKQVHVFG